MRIGIAGLVLPALVALAGCQGMGTGGIEGRWASEDGVSITTFEDGRFSTRVTSTNEVVAEGNYTPAADGLQLTWFSVVAGEQRSAVCRYDSPRRLTCEPRGGDPFSMRRLA